MVAAHRRAGSGALGVGDLLVAARDGLREAVGVGCALEAVGVGVGVGGWEVADC